ncbi:MAG: PH domain-containing protein [Corynebacterium sp.]|uniref:PH domain-containing protein n=1 Tax=Corynebacterium sp. TaxID=1720 RepID=UPI0026DC503A|nr:PH domain-containing protein [Corynebacterium sp.]MDO5099745.1 PH domain-containing protein [Corynebacterium sp.]
MEQQLHPVSPDLTKVRYFTRLPWYVLPALLFAVGALLDTNLWWGWYVAAGFMLLSTWQAWLIPKQVERLGWLETEDNLLLSKGKLWHTFTVVPYGRVQYVDVTQGPFERMYNLKTLKLNTASATVDASVRGLDAQLADELRQRVAQRAKEKMIDL